MRIKLYGIDDIFDFGRYKGKSIRELLTNNPGYVDWLIRNVESFALSQDAFNDAKTITYGKKCVKEDVDNQIEPKKKSLFKKLYGWSYDFSKADILIINNQKIIKINTYNVDNYTNVSYHDNTDWSHYNDDLDMDQQSEEFWGQF